MLVQFGNNWIQKIPRTTPTASSNFGCPHGMADCQIGPGLWPRPILAVLSIFLILPLTNRVRGPYCKLPTEFFPVDLWPKREALGP